MQNCHKMRRAFYKYFISIKSLYLGLKLRITVKVPKLTRYLPFEEVFKGFAKKVEHGNLTSGNRCKAFRHHNSIDVCCKAIKQTEQFFCI